ncbi:PAS domain S-box protein [Pseudomonas sp. RIT-PI-AD]|uniref:PAS domain S-box protein n=1 Tax=Pseudomonas sp. RIT-PI-AD TaxID=3035294 RepID=UPI0021DAFE67|nr:PAS domain S-box protein [Pseudomonas sp. RIT-PI-AD]
MSETELQHLRLRVAELETENARLRGSGATDARRHRAIFDSAVDFAIIATDRDGLVTDWNSGAERILGWTAREMRGEAADRYFTPEDRAAGRVSTEMYQALQSGRAYDERWHLKKGGERFWASGEMMPLRDEDGRHLGFIKILRDQTRQRQAAEAQRADTEFLRGVLASSGDCIQVLDLDGSLIFMSEGGQRAMRIEDLDSLLGSPWETFWQAQSLEAARNALDAARAGGAGQFQGLASPFGGLGTWWDVRLTPILGPDGAPQKVLSVARDITATQQAEQALREAQSLNTLVLNSSRDCIVVLDLDGHVQMISPGGVEAMEFDDEQSALGIPWLEEWKGADHQAALDAVAEARAGGIGRFQGACPTAKGKPKWWDLMISPLPGPDGRPQRLVSVGRDITERTLAETALRDSEARLAAIFAEAAVGLSERSLDGRFLRANAELCRLLGRAPSEVLNATASQVTHPEDLPKSSAAFQQVLHSDRPVILQKRYIRPDGEMVWTHSSLSRLDDEQGRPRSVLTVTVDLTERIAAEERLRASEAKLRELNETLEQRVETRTRERDQVWQTSPDMLCTANLDGYFINLNPAWAKTLGWSDAEMKNQPFSELLHPEDLERTAQAMQQLRRERRVTAFENRYRHRDGGYRWFSWNAVPRDGLVYATVRDVTAMKEQAEALRLAEERLHHSQKMEAVGQLTGGLAHDFNNLLTGIIGSLDLLRTRLGQGRIGDIERYVSAAHGAANRAAALTHRLLAFSRRQTLDPKPTQANRLIAGMEELIQRTVGPAVRVETRAAESLWTTLCDPNQLENALLNLCINARDAMPNGGQLIIETANARLDEAELPAGPYVAISVSDTGSGMSADVAARAFDPFFTTKPLGMGTGLGLSMIYGFAKQSGGQVRIHSEVNVGTTVCLYLPRHLGEPEEEVAEAEFSQAPRAEAGETVLVVDDESAVRMLITEVLEELGYAAIEAGDGAAGLQVLQSDVRIDLLITDVGLPGGMNGRQMADAARQARPGLKVLFITGYAESAVVGNGNLEPGMHVLTKPFALEMLATRIKSIIRTG